jgi:alkylation response protein AidB-like acyl-CoA dehydrogenase
MKQMTPAKIAPLAVALASDAGNDVTGQVFAIRNNEIFLMSQPRPIRSVHRGEGWTPETVAQHALPALKARSTRSTARRTCSPGTRCNAMIRDPETLTALLDTVRRFVRERLVPAEDIVAETDSIPADIVRDMKTMGLFGLTIPESYGGLGLTMEEEALVMIELCQTAPAFRSLIGTTVGIGSQGILMDGTPEQKDRWLPRLASGELIASFALTEPESGLRRGVDPHARRRDGDHYVIDGTKRFITNAPEAGMFTLMARTDPAQKGAAGITGVHRRCEDAGHLARQDRPQDGAEGRPHLRRDLRRRARAGGQRHRRRRRAAASRPR